MGIDCLCIGGAAVDRSFRLVGPAVLGTSNIASSDSGLGGVARNVAESLARLGARTALLWGTPLILLVAGGIFVLLGTRSRRANATKALTAEEQAALDAVLRRE